MSDRYTVLTEAEQYPVLLEFTDTVKGVVMPHDLKKLAAIPNTLARIGGGGDAEKGLEKIVLCIQELLPLAVESIDEAGGCDHSVGLCTCGIDRPVGDARDILSKLQPEDSGESEAEDDQPSTETWGDSH